VSSLSSARNHASIRIFAKNKKLYVGKAVIFRWAVVALFTIGAMAYAYSIITKTDKHVESLPVYGDANEDGTQHIVSDFSLTNQDGKEVTIDTYQDKIFVADFFFATCQSICPVMSGQMERVAGRFKNIPDVMFLSHSVKPDEDSVPVLKQYAADHHANSRQWNFVTGDLTQINDLATRSYLMADTNTTFVHTQMFALIDRERRIRGYYDGTDSLEMNKLIGDIDILLNEKN
jgi:protein SCO1/2